MSPTLAMIHTIAKLVPLFEGLCDELMPEIARFHIADEAVLQMLLAAQRLTPEIYRRLGDDAACAEAVGADAILLTCSSSSPCVDVIQNMVAVPLLKIDEAMVDKAISIGTRIGVAATAATTVKPTADLIAMRSRSAGKETQVDVALSEEGHRAMLSGDMARHDRIVRDSLFRLMETNDVVVLAQVSMARVAQQIPESERRVPILSSPRLCLERVRQLLGQP
jgi:Asp/Glu/hydantoin racemase